MDLAADGSRSASSSGGGFDGGCGKVEWMGQGGAAPAVHRQQLRRDAAEGHGSVLYREKLSLTAARWRLAAFDSDAGDGVVFDPWSFFPYVFCTCIPTVYAVCGLC